MNVNTGIFTAPVSGVYYFVFQGFKGGTAGTLVGLYVNNEVFEMVQDFATGATAALSLAATVPLKERDRVRMVLRAGSLNNPAGAFVSFNGFLLQQEFSL
jgi:hypothetical protein